MNQPASNGRAVAQYEVSDIERMARAISASKLFGIASPEQAIALCLIAQAEGRHPASAAQDYHIIQGKPSKKADAMLRDFINAGGKVEWHKLDDDVADATFSHPGGGSVRITWDHARAKQAGISNPMWRKYPRQMLRSRVVSEGVRTVYPLATSGMYVPEEVVEFVPREAEAVNVIEHDAPKKRVRDGSDGSPKSSRQAKLSNDWTVTEEIRDIANVAELEEWRESIAERVASMPPQWRETFETEIYAPKLAKLRKDAEPLSEADSAAMLKKLLAMVGQCSSAGLLRLIARDNKSLLRSLTAEDYTTFEDAYDTRLNTLPSEE